MTVADRLTHGRWMRIALALAAGAGAALVHPPFGVLPGLLGYPLVLVLAERSRTVRGAVWMGWLAGFAYFLIGCWWVAEAFLVNPEQAWMAPFAASLLPAGVGLFWAGATGLYRRLAPKGVGRFLIFAVLFSVFEWLRGHVLTGFPWNPAGAGWRAGTPLSQTASLVGVYGLGFITVAAFSALAILRGAGSRRLRGGVVLAALAVPSLLWVWGAQRLGAARDEPTSTVVRLVQANVDQESKWTAEAYQGIVRRYVELTAQPSRTGRRPDIVLWPEGSLPAAAGQVFAADAWEGRAISDALQPGQTLLMGLARAEADPSSPEGARYFNSLFALTDEGGAGLRVTAVYDKHRLVPFGEYLPLGGMMSALGVRSLVHMPADFSAGPKPSPLRLPGRPDVQPLICYESLYPGFTPGGAQRPQWIANVSNDAWFGRTSGPRQHLNLASYRAIETGLPTARATPTGVSAMIDAYGRVVVGARLEPGEMGVVDVAIPAAVAETLYSRTGDLVLLFLLGLGLIGAFAIDRRSRKIGAVRPQVESVLSA